MAEVKRYMGQPDHVAIGRYIRSLGESRQIIDFKHE
jgi:hypothetical protein